MFIYRLCTYLNGLSKWVILHSDAKRPEAIPPMSCFPSEATGPKTRFRLWPGTETIWPPKMTQIISGWW